MHEIPKPSTDGKIDPQSIKHGRIESVIPTDGKLDPKSIKHGPIESARFHTDLFIGGKQVTPNGPASTTEGWVLVEDGDFLWLKHRDGAWGKTHMSNVRYIRYLP